MSSFFSCAPCARHLASSARALSAAASRAALSDAMRASIVAVLALVLDLIVQSVGAHVMVGFAYKISTDYFKINPIISHTSL